jgi:biopolymer transport protein ExbD
MAQIQDTGGDGKGKKRAKKGVPHIDMTPMVDLAFLLLTFFVMTTTFSKPMVMKVVYPAKPKNDKVIPPSTLINNALTFILTKDRAFYYDGEFFPEGNTKAQPATTLTEIDMAGVRKLLAERNKFVIDKKKIYADQLYKKEIMDTTYVNLMTEAQKDQKAVKVLIKTDDKALTKAFVNMIDECMIADIGTYTHVDINQDELNLLNTTLNK